jgi:hypothetical protein
MPLKKKGTNKPLEIIEVENETSPGKFTVKDKKKKEKKED